MTKQTHIGPPQAHDARIAALEHVGDRCVVTLQTIEGQRLEFAFERVGRLESNAPVGMLLYAVTEVPMESPPRHFIFVNWEDDDPSRLEIIADSCAWRVAGQSEWRTV